MRPPLREERFWSQIGHASQELVTRFANHLQGAEEDVVMFTARKAACFADALRLVRAWTPHSELCSDEALELDTTWLAGRRVLVVDDVIGTGQTVDYVLSRLEAVGVKSCRLLYIASSEEWPASIEALQQRHPDVEFTPAPVCAQSATGIAQELVRCLAAVPRPYNIDWPLMTGWSLSADRIDAFIAHLSWRARATTSAFHGNLGIRTLTLEPPAKRIPGLLEPMDAPGAQVGLLKVRLYAEPTRNGTFDVSVLPILAFDRLPLAAITPLLDSLGLPGTCATGHSNVGLARIANYFAALRMIQDFERLMACQLIGQELVESHWQHALALGPSAASSASSASSASYNAKPLSAVLSRPPVSLRSVTRSSRQTSKFDVVWPHARFALTKFLWQGSMDADRLTRRRAIQLSDADTMVRFLSAQSRQPGYRVSELAQELNSRGFENLSPVLASAFLDDAIDNGLTVPSLREVDGSIERVFRAGETIAFGLREQRLLWVMLDALIANAPNLDVGRILLEKILVLAIRYGSEQTGLLHPTQLPAALPALTVAYSRYGSIATTDQSMFELPIANEETHTLGRELAELSLISWSPLQSGRRGDRLKVLPCRLDRAATHHEVAFRRIGALIAQILTQTSVGNQRFESFVVLCNAGQVPLALGAEVKRIVRDLDKVGEYLSQMPYTIPALSDRVRNSETWVLSLQSGLDKLDAIARHVVDQVIAELGGELDQHNLLTWQEVTSLVVKQTTVPGELSLMRQLASWLLSTASHVQAVRAALGLVSRRPVGIDKFDLPSLSQSLDVPAVVPSPEWSLKEWGECVRDLCRQGQSLLDEVAVGYDEMARREVPKRYQRAILMVSVAPMDSDIRDLIEAGLGRLAVYQAALAAPLPAALLGPRVAGFAVHDREMEIMEQLYPYLSTIPGLEDAHLVVLRNLSDGRRLLRRRFNSEWHGGGFSRLAQSLPDVCGGFTERFLIVDDARSGME